MPQNEQCSDQAPTINTAVVDHEEENEPVSNNGITDPSRNPRPSTNTDPFSQGDPLINTNTDPFDNQKDPLENNGFDPFNERERQPNTNNPMRIDDLDDPFSDQDPLSDSAIRTPGNDEDELGDGFDLDDPDSDPLGPINSGSDPLDIDFDDDMMDDLGDLSCGANCGVNIMGTRNPEHNLSPEQLKGFVTRMRKMEQLAS